MTLINLPDDFKEFCAAIEEGIVEQELYNSFKELFCNEPVNPEDFCIETDLELEVYEALVKGKDLNILYEQ